VIHAYVESGAEQAKPDERFQFERHGYFVADRVDSTSGRPVFNRIVTLKDSWGG
jgi:glutaminyl-tRNA synthetase